MHFLFRFNILVKVNANLFQKGSAQYNRNTAYLVLN